MNEMLTLSLRLCVRLGRYMIEVAKQQLSASNDRSLCRYNDELHEKLNAPASVAVAPLSHDSSLRRCPEAALVFFLLLLLFSSTSDAETCPPRSLS